MNLLKKIYKISKYIFLSALLLVFALVRSPFSSDKEDGELLDGTNLNSLFPEAHADAPADGGYPADSDDGK